jgi:hypothetical protein
VPEGQLQRGLHSVVTIDIDVAASHPRKANIAQWLP